MKKIVLIIFATSFNTIANAQVEPTFKCGTEAPNTSKKYTSELKKKPISNNHEKSIGYTIPVVFHVTYDPNFPSSNISQAQIEDALRILNEDYQKLNTDVNNVLPTFQGLQGDAQIEFVFAHTAPDGTSFNGITRSPFVSSSGNNLQSEIVAAVTSENDVYNGSWSDENYLNIFIAHELGTQGVVAYSYPPCPHLSGFENNSIYIRHNFVGSIGTGNSAYYRPLTHEIGHWLGLNHLAGNPADCGHDDGIADTPNTDGQYNNTECSVETRCGEVSNKENFLEYQSCTAMFTLGQVEYMHQVLEDTTDCGHSNIWSDENLLATGALLSLNEPGSMNSLEATMYPNPNNGQFIIGIQSENSSKVNLEIRDCLGKIIFNESNVQMDGNNQLILNQSSLAVGMYTLSITTKDKKQSIRFVKE